jgi:uncharacterized protein YwqG
MPLCTNDNTKKYTGKETSPLGLGYTASVEPINKLMIGKDDQVYIVTQLTNITKRWKKVTDIGQLFDNLPEQYYTKAYLPITEEIENETGLEEKFGGEIPFFVKGEVWPSTEDYHMTFFCQLKDPRKKDNMLYRIFVLLDDSGIQEDYWITKIELSPENIKNQIIVKKPEYIEEIKSSEYFCEEKFEPFEIKKWSSHSELSSFNKIKEYYHIPDYVYKNNNDLYNKLESEYNDHSRHPAPGVKVGGTPISTQDQDTVLSYDFLQIEYESYIPYMWGDCGVAHVSEDCQLTWDCC